MPDRAMPSRDRPRHNRLAQTGLTFPHHAMPSPDRRGPPDISRLFYAVQRVAERHPLPGRPLLWHLWAVSDLGSILTNHIWLRCVCGHHTTLPVAELVEAVGPAVKAAQVATRARCRRCGSKGRTEFRITYVGGSFSALDGTRTGRSLGFGLIRRSAAGGTCCARVSYTCRTNFSNGSGHFQLEQRTTARSPKRLLSISSFNL